jgi:hypothetical protein
MNRFTRLALCCVAACISNLVIAALPVDELKIPDGFEIQPKSKDGLGVALFSRKSVRLWENKDGIGIHVAMDNSTSLNDTNIAIHAQDFVRQVVERAKKWEPRKAVRYTAGTKQWVWINLASKEPEKEGPDRVPDIVMLITGIKSVAAIVQVYGPRDRFGEVRQVATEIINLNSPAPVSETKAR